MPHRESSDARWTFDDVHAAIVQRFADSPYAVKRKGDTITVQADLADATFLTWAHAHHVDEIRGVEVTARNGKAITRDYARSISVSAGSARLTGSVNYTSGRAWSYERHVEIGVGLDGTLGRQVDYTYSPDEIQRPVNEILERSGWHAGAFGSLPTDAKIGAVVAIVTVVGLVIAGLVLLALG